MKKSYTGIQQMNYISQWYTYLKNKSCDEKKITDVINKLTEKYNEKHRYYHNLNHIKNMYNSLSGFKDKIQDNESIFYAAWFHDVIYETGSPDNEEKSSNYAREVLSNLYIDEKIIEKVTQLILITKNHYPLENSYDEKIFLDSDLSILGQSQDKYKDYMESIRKEYHWVDDIKYKENRIAVLNRFLQRPYIYFTDEFKNLYESAARINIQCELDYLK